MNSNMQRCLFYYYFLSLFASFYFVLKQQSLLDCSWFLSVMIGVGVDASCLMKSLLSSEQLQRWRGGNAVMRKAPIRLFPLQKTCVRHLTFRTRAEEHHHENIFRRKILWNITKTIHKWEESITFFLEACLIYCALEKRHNRHKHTHFCSFTDIIIFQERFMFNIYSQFSICSINPNNADEVNVQFSLGFLMFWLLFYLLLKISCLQDCHLRTKYAQLLFWYGVNRAHLKSLRMANPIEINKKKSFFSPSKQTDFLDAQLSLCRQIVICIF